SPRYLPRTAGRFAARSGLLPPHAADFRARVAVPDGDAVGVAGRWGAEYVLLRPPPHPVLCPALHRPVVGVADGSRSRWAVPAVSPAAAAVLPSRTGFSSAPKLTRVRERRCEDGD